MFDGMPKLLKRQRRLAALQATDEKTRKRGMVTQKAMAARGGMSKSAWGRIERGKTINYVGHFESIAKACGFTVIELWAEKHLIERESVREYAAENGLRPPGVDSSPLMLWVERLFRRDVERLEAADREKFEEQRMAVVETATALYRQFDLARKFYDERTGDEDAT